MAKKLDWMGLEFKSVTLYYYLFLCTVILAVVICHRLQHSRIGRAWMAIREDEVAAQAMGLNTRNLKLLAFSLGATFGGVAGSFFAAFQQFISPESFGLMESVMVVAMVVLGGAGHLPGVILGALLLAILPESSFFCERGGDMEGGRSGRPHEQSPRRRRARIDGLDAR